MWADGMDVGICGCFILLFSFLKPKEEAKASLSEVDRHFGHLRGEKRKCLIVV